MKLTELIDKLNEKFPENICESWDNVGLLLGDKDKEVKKVLIALEVNSKAIDKAIPVSYTHLTLPTKRIV